MKERKKRGSKTNARGRSCFDVLQMKNKINPLNSKSDARCQKCNAHRNISTHIYFIKMNQKRRNDPCIGWMLFQCVLVLTRVSQRSEDDNKKYSQFLMKIYVNRSKKCICLCACVYVCYIGIGILIHLICKIGVMWVCVCVRHLRITTSHLMNQSNINFLLLK